MRDAVAAGLPGRPDRAATASCRPTARRRLPYRLLPTERGNFAFGDVSVRCRGPLGLAFVDRRLPAGEAVQVYPNLLEVRRYEALVRTTLVRAGGYRAKRLPGAGREFSHYRDYTPDDDYRHVSWKATARRNKPITAVFESEHSQDIIFCLDVGRMMAARVGTLTKLDHAINAVLMLTHVSQTFQDNLGLLVFSHTVHLYLPPAKGRAQHAQFLQALYSVKPELLLRQLPRGVQLPDRPAPEAGADDGVHRPARRRGVDGVPGRGGAAAALPPAADAGRGRRAVAEPGRRSSRATPSTCTMC